MKKVAAIIITLFFSSIINERVHSQTPPGTPTEPSSLSEQLKKSLEALDMDADIEEIKNKMTEILDAEKIEELKKSAEEQIEKLNEEDIVKQYKDVQEKIESNEIENLLKEFWPESGDSAMIHKMEDAMDQLKKLKVEKILKDGQLVLGNDTLDLNKYLNTDSEIIKKLQKDFGSLDENFRTVYPNIDVILKSLDSGFEDARNLDLERMLEKIQKTYSQPKNKSISI